MRIVTVKPKDPVVLGRQGEHNVTQVRFDISQMITLYGEGVAELVYRRVGDAEPYPVPLERDGIYVVWTVTSVDTEKSGLGGKAELRWYVGDALAKSDTYSVSVDAAMGVAGEIPDPPGQTWLDQALEAGAQAKGSADAAQEAKAEAVGAKDAAVQAAEAAKTVAARPPIIMGSTGNWWVWSEEAGEYKDTGLSSYGPAGADGKTPYIANGCWYIGGVSTGVPATGPAGADGYTPVKGKDYWTEADKEEIADEAADKLEQRVDWLPTIDVVADDLLAEQTITLKPYYNNGYNYYSIVGDDAFALVGGQKYIVTWDGVEYECTATVDTSARVPITFVGGHYVEGFGFSEYPFAIMTNEENAEYDYVKQAVIFSSALEDTTASYDVTVRIQAITETYNKMPAGFLPDDLSTVSVALDTTLTEEGKAADAKAVGDAIGQLSKVNADWSVNDESDPAYVKNRTHYEETADVTVFTDDQGVFLDQTGDGINDQLYMPVGVDIRLGETYIVTYNGVEYECVSQDFMQGADDILYFVIGNASAYDGLTGNGEPFLVHYCPGLLENAGENYSGYVERTTAFAIDSCSIVAKNRTVVHKLPSKFLPDDLSTGSVTLDATLTEEGQAADAKATGDAIGQLSQDKLDKTELTTAVNTALAQAKQSGEFDGPQGPAGAGLDVTGASAGQIVQISTVDENGVPTAWEPADMPSGGGGEWETLIDETLTEAASYTNDNFDHSKKEYLLSIFVPAQDAKLTSDNSSFLGGKFPVYYITLGEPTYNMLTVVRYEAISENKQFAIFGQHKLNASINDINPAAPASTNAPKAGSTLLDRNQNLKIGATLPAGTRIVLEGR